MGKTTSKEANVQLSVEERLRALYNLQRVDTEIDKIKILRGELPLEVQDLEDEVAGLETRLENYKNDIVNLETAISNKKIAIKESEALIAKYTEQQKNVRNNREYDSLSKEIEFQTLEIELSNKKIKQFFAEIESKKIQIEEAEKKIADVKAALQAKKEELENIVNETQKEEEDLKKKSEEISQQIEPRLLTAYRRIRSNARNGLAVVSVERDACGGCFNKIPPQRQLDINSRKKIIVCEYCGRILVDKDINMPLEEVEAMRKAKLEQEREQKTKRKSRRTKKA
jgi:predicted  nucleic acid-binding Zn-ribbon protein